MKQVDILIEELDKLSTNNPIYLLKVGTLLRELVNETLLKSENSTHYAQVLARHRKRCQNLDVSVLDIMSSAEKSIDLTTCNVTLPLAAYFKCCSDLEKLYILLYRIGKDSDDTVRSFLNEKLNASKFFVAKKSELFWDEITYLTIYITQCKRYGLLPKNRFLKEITLFIRIKQEAIRYKAEMFSKLGEDLMRCFGDNLIIYDQVDIEKLKVLYCFLMEEPIENALNSFLTKFHDANNPLRISEHAKNKVLIDFLAFSDSFKEKQDIFSLAEDINRDNKIADFLPITVVKSLRLVIYKKLSVISSEEMQDFIANYIAKEITCGNLEFNSICSDTDNEFNEKVQRLIKERWSLHDEQN